MTQKKRLLCLLLALCMLLTLFNGCNRNTKPNTEGTETSDKGPKRPPDPGVIAPLSEESELPEDGIVWDMENIPDNLNAAQWATSIWTSHDDYIENNIEFLGVDGKGYAGSRALALRQNGKYIWCDVYSLGMKMDETATLNWKGGEMLWIWYDSSEIACNMKLELELNGAHLAQGTPFYVMDDGGSVAKKGGKCPEAWEGAGYGRLPLSGNSKGWIGVPLNAFEVGLRKIAFFNVHLSYDGGSPTDTRLYLDNFCVTTDGLAPMGAELSEVSAKLATSDKAAWDMENIPDDMLGSYWAIMDGAGWDGFIQNNIRLSGVNGAGVDGSRALCFRQIGKYNGCDQWSLGITNDKTAYSDWSGGEYLWFWVNNAASANDLRVDLYIDNQKPAIGTPYYGIGSDLKPEQAGTFTLAWDGANYGRMTVGAGYKGWVGVPLSAYGEVTDILNISLHIAYQGKTEVEGTTVYFDDFWVLKEGEIPKNGYAASVSTLRGGYATGDIKLDPGKTAKLPCEVWTMDKLPSAPVSAGWASPEYGMDPQFIKNNVTYFAASGKGWKGSTALGIRQNGAYAWADIYNVNLSKDSTAIRNFSNGKVLWFWIDTTEHSEEVRLDLRFDGQAPTIGGTYYVVADGETVGATKEIKPAWDGADYGRLSFTVGYRGWVGIPLTSFKPTLGSGSIMQIHVAYSGENVKGKAVYLDSLWLTNDLTCPNGVKIRTASDEDTKVSSDKAAWDMENTPNNLVSTSWAIADYAGNPEYIANNVQYLGAAGKGVNDSRAVEVRFNGSYAWADQFTLNLKEDASAATDWTGGELLWVWVDASGLVSNMEMEIWLEGVKINAGAGYYEVKNGSVSRAGDLIVAWDGYGRIPLQKDYIGYIGVPLSGYGKVTKVRSITLHFGGEGVVKGSSLYIDDLWVTKLNEIPKGAKDGYFYEEERPITVTLPAVLWDMEALSAEPMSQGFVTAKQADNAEYKPGNVTFGSAAGKGYNGSRALTITQNGAYHWADIFNLNVSADKTAGTDWNGASFVWLWVDAGQFGTDITVDFYADGKYIMDGTDYYTVRNGVARPAGKSVKAWSGAENGRFRITAGYAGWIGIPISAFNRKPVTVKTIELHLGYGADTGYQGKTLYLDQLMITDEKTGPDGCQITDEPAQEDPDLDKAVWTMESLPADLSSVISTAYGHGTQLGTYVDAVKGVGRGWHSSTGLGYKYLKYLDGNNGDNILQISLSSGIGGDTDWSGAGTIWFWIDASEMTTPLLLELMLNWARPKIGAKCYFWDGVNEPTESTLPAAWGGNTTEGRVQLASGYVGWVGVEAAAYSGIDFSNIDNIILYFEPSKDAASLPKTVYFDNFWLTASGNTPSAVGYAGDPGSGAGEDEPDPFTEADAGKKLWTMESLPTDLNSAISTAYGKGTPLGTYVDALIASGKGYNGTNALGYKYIQYIDGNNGDNVLQIELAKAGAVTDWSQGGILWFWVDAREMQTALLLEVMIDWVRPSIGSPYYLWSGSGTPTEKSLPAAWGGNTKEGRVQLTSGYCGWVGIPLKAYSGLSLSNVSSLVLYFEPSQDAASLPKTVYFDNFWLTEENKTIDLSAVRSVRSTVYTLPDAVLPAEPELPAAPEQPAEPVDGKKPEEETDGICTQEQTETTTEKTGAPAEETAVSEP